MNLIKNVELTVIIPVYNGEKYIYDTVMKILKSCDNKIEVLLIDDGSTDKSREICLKLCKDDNRVTYFFMNNSGIDAARNKGIELSQGEYICFCDQDDEMVISVFCQLISDMKQKSATMGICSTGRLINNIKSDYEKVKTGCYENKDVLSGILYPILFRGYNYDFVADGNYLYGTLWKCIFERSFIKENSLSFITFVNYEDDWLFVTKALSYANKVVTSEKTGYYWRINNESKSHNNQYIEEIIHKFKLQDSYVYQYLMTVTEDKILDKYKSIRLCEHYVDIIENIVCADKHVRHVIKHQFKEYLFETDYKEQLKIQKDLSKSVFRRRLVCKTLDCFGVEVSTAFNCFLRFCEYMMMKINFLAVWERNRKLKK